jgi:hypothetical protein
MAASLAGAWCYARAMLDPKQRHKLLMADRTRDTAWITAVIENVLAADRTVTLAEVEAVFRDAAAASYVIADGTAFRILIGMPAMLAAVAAAGMTPAANRTTLVDKVIGEARGK